MTQDAAQDQDIGILDNLIYATHDGQALPATLYRPGGPGPHPVLIGAGGGGFRRSNRYDHRQWGILLARHGYALLSIQYRATPDTTPTFPQAVHDVIAAVQYVRGKAAEFDVDPERIGLMGSSAGAHLAAMAALAHEHPAFKGAYPDDPFAGESARVRGLIGVYGTYDLAAAWHDQLRFNEHPGAGTLKSFLGKDLYEDQQLYFLASPISHISYETVKDLAVFLPYGVVDDLVLPETQTLPFLRALRLARNLAMACPVPDAGHLWFHIDPISDPNSASAFLAPRLLRFLAISPLAVAPMVTDTTTAEIKLRT